MSFKSLTIVVVVAAAAVAAHKAMATPPEPAPVAAPKQGVALAHRVTAAPASALPVASGFARAHQVFGNIGVRLIGPGVEGMIVRTETILDELKPSIQKAPVGRRLRAETVAKQIRALDKLANEHIEEGRPLAGFRAAMQARGLIDAVRHQVIEESIR
ncbi:hypothetical protein BH23GEM9_BH23GEM9_23700 [soil metagenome]